MSAHPLVLGEFEKLLARPGFQIVTKQLESNLAPELRRVVLPKANIYVFDAHTSQQAAASLISNILEQSPGARLIVVGEKFSEAHSYSLLRMGAKGLLTYSEAREQLPEALPLVAAGGFWVPRVLLSNFVDSILNGAHGRQFKNAAAADLSHRIVARKSLEQRDRKQAQHLRAHGEISRFEFAEQIRCAPPRRPYPSLLPEARNRSLNRVFVRRLQGHFIRGASLRRTLWSGFLLD